MSSNEIKVSSVGAQMEAIQQTQPRRECYGCVKGIDHEQMGINSPTNSPLPNESSKFPGSPHAFEDLSMFDVQPACIASQGFCEKCNSGLVQYIATTPVLTPQAMESPSFPSPLNLNGPEMRQALNIEQISSYLVNDQSDNLSLTDLGLVNGPSHAIIESSHKPRPRVQDNNHSVVLVMRDASSTLELSTNAGRFSTIPRSEQRLWSNFGLYGPYKHGIEVGEEIKILNLMIISTTFITVALYTVQSMPGFLKFRLSHL